MATEDQRTAHARASNSITNKTLVINCRTIKKQHRGHSHLASNGRVRKSVVDFATISCKVHQKGIFFLLN